MKLVNSGQVEHVAIVMQKTQNYVSELSVLKKYSEILFFLLLLGLVLLLPYTKIDPVLGMYYNTIKYAVDRDCPSQDYYHPNQILMKFDNLQGQTIGMCTRTINRYTIRIDSSWWSEARQDERFQLMAHELSHCILGADHVDDRHSFMSSTFQTLSMSEVILQLRELIKEKCH